MSDADLLDRVRRLVAAQNRLAAQLARAVRTAENRQAADHDGLKSMRSWLRTHTRLSGAAVSEVVQHGRTLELLPAVDSAFAAGEVTGQLPVRRTVKPQLLVLIDEADLVDPATGPGAATAGTGALLSAARTRRIACDSTVSRVVLGPDSAPIDLGRTQRIVSAAQRRALDARDRSCVFAGCVAPNRWCEAHHVLEWVFDGPTDLDDLGLLCERHHTKVHHGFRVERQPDGRWRTWRPDGTEILLSAPLRAA